MEPTSLVSVVMPVRNEQDFIPLAIRSVLAQDYPAELIEIIVVDGRSTDGTVAAVERVRAGVGPRDRDRIQIIENEQRTVPTALNLGIERSQGEVILRVDGHCDLSPDYVSTCVKILGDGHFDCVGGVLETTGEGLVGRAIALAQSSRFGVGDASFRVGTLEGEVVDTVAFGAYRRDVFERIGVFDVDLVRNQDDEFNFRLLRNEGRIWLEPSITARYRARSSVRGVARQYFQYGLFKVRVAQKHRGVATARQLVPPLFVGALLLGLLLAVTGRRRPVTWLASSYLAGNLLATADSVRRDPVGAAALPLVFAAMHVSYGAGYLFGLPYWLVRGRRRGVDEDWRLSR